MRKLIEKICECCGKPYKTREPKQRFCSQSCAVSHNNRKRKISEETKLKRSESLKEHYKKNPKEAKNGFRWIDGKKTRVELVKCPICGSTECKRKGICRHMRKFFENLIYFGFNKDCLGTEAVFNECERVKKILEKEYFDNHLSPSDLKEKYNYPKTYENITQLLKSIGIKTRDLSKSISNGVLSGNINLPSIVDNKGFAFKQGWHTTWNGKTVFYRSGAELKYAELLDESKIPYEVEELRVEYYDSVKKCNRIAIPDFLLTETNEIVEVKSRITFHKQNMIDKFQKYKELGYNPKLLYDGIMYNSEEIESIEESNFII